MLLRIVLRISGLLRDIQVSKGICFLMQGIFARFMIMWKKQILTRALRAQKGNCGEGLVNKYRWGWAGAQSGWVTTFSAFLMGWVMLFSTPGRGGSSYFKPCIFKYCKLQKPSVSLGGKSPCKIYIKLAGKGQLTKQNPTS